MTLNNMSRTHLVFGLGFVEYWFRLVGVRQWGDAICVGNDSIIIIKTAVENTLRKHSNVTENLKTCTNPSDLPYP